MRVSQMHFTMPIVMECISAKADVCSTINTFSLVWNIENQISLHAYVRIKGPTNKRTHHYILCVSKSLSSTETENYSHSFFQFEIII